MTSTAVQAATRPAWAKFVAFGFLIAAFSCLLLAVGALGTASMIGPGFALLAVGAATAMLGAFAYFVSR